METKPRLYSIVLRQAPIPGIGGGVHSFWVLLDPDRHVVEELHGEAWNRANQRIATFADIMRGDNQLKFFPRIGASYWSANALPGDKAFFSRPVEKLQELIDRWNAAKKLGKFLSEKNIDYRAFDYNPFSDTYAPNSNAMTYSLGKAMGLHLERPSSVNGEHYLMPGWLREFQKEYPDAPRSPFNTGQPEEKRAPNSDFRNETGNNVPADQATLANPVQLASYRYAPTDDPTQRTVTPAMRALNAAKADDAFTKRYLKGDRDAVDRMHALHRAAYPEPDDATVGPAIRPAAMDTSAVRLSAGTRDVTPASQALEAAKADSGFVKSYLDGDRNAFARMQSLIQAAYPEPDDSRADADGGWAQHPSANGANAGLAPWLGDALAGNAFRDEGADPTMAGWLGDWRDDLQRRD